MKNIVRRILLKRFGISILLVMWFLTGWPIVWQNPEIPPKTSQAIADASNSTFSFTSDAESWSAVTSGGSSPSVAWSESDGNPSAGSLRTFDTKSGGGATTSNNYWQWVGTWEDLGVPSENTITLVRGGYNYRVLQYGNTTSQTGPLEFRIGASCTLQGELLALTSIGSTVGWTTRSQGSDVSVPSGSQASTSQICFRLNNRANLAGGTRTFELFEDTIALTITYQPAAVVSLTLTTDGMIAYGTLASGETVSTIDLTDTQTIQNDGNTTENFNIKTSAPSGWTLGSSSSSDTFVHEFSTNSGSNWTQFSDVDTYQTLVTSVAASATQNFDLRFTAPDPSTTTSQKTITITLQAVAP